jgi:flagellar basal body-associated protein FliL
MKSMTNQKLIALIAGLVVTALAVTGYFYWRSEKKSAVEQALEQATAPTIEVPTNPLQEKVPTLNPVEKVNPFSGYQNPF